MRVARHRMVNEALAEELHSRVHALVIEAKSPEEDLAFVDLTATDERLRKLLGLSGLPTDDLSGKRFIGMIRGGELAAAGGLDLVLPYVLLRSVAVNADLRGGGFGRVMVIRLLGEARNAGAKAVFLLTASAQPFFSTLGFENISRDNVPAEIASTSQFTGSTCSTAQRDAA